MPLLLVVTTRNEDPSAAGGYHAYLGRLARSSSVTTMSLEGIDVAAAALLIDEIGVVMDAEAGVAQTGGNPLFLRELARGGPGGRSLREVVADRFESLATNDIDVVDAAAVVGDPIDAALLATALEHAFRKLEVSTRTGAVARAAELRTPRREG